MSSDIQLGDDGSLTLVCNQLRLRSTAVERSPISVIGVVQLDDRVLLSAPPAPPADPISPARWAGIGRHGPDASPLWGGKAATAGPADTGTYTGGRAAYSPVYARLKSRPLPLDLWQELQMLREAVLDLHQRLKRAGI